MPLWENVGGTPKKITKLWQNVGGTPTLFTSFKQNISGTFVELLKEYIAKFEHVAVSGSSAGSSNSNRSEFDIESGWSVTKEWNASATGVTGPTAYHSIIYSLSSINKTFTLKVTGTYSGSGSIKVTVNDTDLVTSSPVSITRTIESGDTLTVTCSGSVGYTVGGSYNMTITIT